MKKGLTILGATACLGMLMSCDNNKVTKINILALPYVICNEWYPLSYYVEGKGVYSDEVTWTTDNENATITPDLYFKYTSSTFTNPVPVTITATSKENPSVKKSFVITVVGKETNKTTFIEKATAGQTYLNGVLAAKGQTFTINVDHGEYDFAWGRKRAISAVTEAKYTIKESAVTAGEAEANLTIKIDEGKTTTTRRVPTVAQLQEKIDSGDCSCYTFSDGDDTYYTYYLVVANEGEEVKTTYSVFSKGLLINHVYFEGDVCYTNLNFTPHWPE